MAALTMMPSKFLCSCEVSKASVQNVEHFMHLACGVEDRLHLGRVLLTSPALSALLPPKDISVGL